MTFPIGEGLPNSVTVSSGGVRSITKEQFDNPSLLSKPQTSTTANGTVENAKATILREEQLGAQPVPQTPYNMDLGQGAKDIARLIPRTVAELAMGNSGKTTEPVTMDPISRFLLGDESIKSLPTQAAETETALNKAGVKGKLATGLAVTGVAANTVLNLLPFLAPFEDFAQSAADKAATNSLEVTLSPDQLSKMATSDLVDSEGKSLVGQQKIVGEKFQEVAKFYADKGQSLTVDARAPAESVTGKIATALGGENKAPFATLTEGGKPIEAPTPFSHETLPALTESNQTAISPFAHEETIQPSAGVSPFAHEQTPVPIGNITKISDNFYKQTYLSNDQSSFVPVEKAKPVDLGIKADTFIHRGANGTGWVVTEGKTGTLISTGNTQIQAIQNAKDMIEGRGQEGFDKAIEQKISENGLTPRYSQPSSSITLTAEIVPGLSKTIEQDILPMAKGTGQRIADIYHEVANIVNPTGQAPKEALDIIMKAKGNFEKTLFRTEQTQKAITKAWDKQPEDNRLAFMAKIEEGTPSNMLGMGNKDLATMYRDRLNNAHVAISQYKDVNFLENFFPHFWQRPGEVAKNFMRVSAATRPMEGNKSFLKHRIFQSIQEGIAAGYKPITTNPEELMQIYETNVQKFLMAQKIVTDLKKIGLRVYLPKGKPVPPGYAEINDKIAKVYFPPQEVQINEAGFKKTVYPEAGRYVFPEPVARLINNHLSTDWVQSSPIGRTLMQAKNSINALQLGFSAFHVTAETLNAVMTGLDVGLSKIARGEILGGAKAVVTAPFNIVNYWRDGQKFYQGNPELMAIENDVFDGGATLKKNQYFKNTVLDNFGKNVREGNLPGALGRLPLAAIEGGTRLIFSQIPKVKIGAFRQLFSEELERYSKRGQLGKKTAVNEKGQEIKTRATIAREVWNNIENRFGQINYDNMFWSKTFKSINMLLWRAVGWNTGTIRELGGAATQDFYRFAQDAIHGRKPDFTPKMRYTMAIIATVATLSAIYEYLHTGHGPKNLEEYFYPENGATDTNGDPVRVQFPTYMKDIYGYSQHPIQTVANKLSPELSIMMQLLQNRDYYGNYVYNEQAGLPTKLGQSLQYIATQMEPFSITNLINLNKGKATPEEKAEGFLGVQKAPADISQSDQTKAIFNQMHKGGPQTPEEQALSANKNKYRAMVQEGNIPSFDVLKSAGIVTDAKGYRAFIKAAQLTPVQRAYKTLPKGVKAVIPKP